ncbi:MAG: molybdopterin converting factor subunit 1 [Alphaproteobacteria bacterium]|nr:MAG: molybdopterin converting factor subunit 1 [Alphaproteobacteria bacterium]
MEISYFARIREDIGHGSEIISLPENISDVNGLIKYLCEQGKNYETAFKNEAALRVAVNQTYVDFDHPVKDSDDIAFFPPMTGG